MKRFLKRLGIFFKLKAKEIIEAIKKLPVILLLCWFGFYLFCAFVGTGSLFVEKEFGWTFQYYLMDLFEKPNTYSLINNVPPGGWLNPHSSFLSNIVILFFVFPLIGFLITSVSLLPVVLFGCFVGFVAILFTIITSFLAWIYSNWQMAGDIVDKEIGK